MDDPPSDELGAVVGQNLEDSRQAKRHSRDIAGVIEGRPGIIETSHIDPLKEASLYEDEWKSTGSSSAGSAGRDSGGEGGGAAILEAVASVAGGAARMTYGVVTGDEQAKRAGKEAVYGLKYKND